VSKLFTFILIGVLLVFYSLRPGGFLSQTELGHVAALYARLDKFHIIVKDGLKLEKVDVYCPNRNDEGDLDFIRIIHQGKPDEPLPREHGGLTFIIKYDGHLILERQQIKLAWWYYHSYTIVFSKNNNDVVSATISSVGPSEWRDSAEE
jgi:hypothetical protein